MADMKHLKSGLQRWKRQWFDFFFKAANGIRKQIGVGKIEMSMLKALHFIK